MDDTRMSSDRFLIALVFAAIVHALLILGVGFEMPKPERVRPPLPITLVPAPSQKPPERADFLAQENQAGGGEAKKPEVPKTAPAPVAPRKEPGPHVEHRPLPARAPEVKPQKPVVKQQQSKKKVVETPPVDEPREDHPEPQPRKISAELLSQQIAEVSADWNRSEAKAARETRIVYVNSVNAHKYKATEYERAWQEKVERIGNLNYPDQARRQSLSGSLVMSVGLRPDGSVYSMQVRQSSGHEVLDNAAKNIVKLAAPFAAFPAELRKEADVLVITRTWRFSSDSKLDTR